MNDQTTRRTFLIGTAGRPRDRHAMDRCARHTCFVAGGDQRVWATLRYARARSLELPPMVENGNAVPMTVRSRAR